MSLKSTLTGKTFLEGEVVVIVTKGMYDSKAGHVAELEVVGRFTESEWDKGGGALPDEEEEEDE